MNKKSLTSLTFCALLSISMMVSAGEPIFNQGTFEIMEDGNWPEAEPDTPQVKRLDNIGSEFYFAFMPNRMIPTTELYLTTNYKTTVIVEWPANNPQNSKTYNLIPGTVQMVELPADDVIFHGADDGKLGSVDSPLDYIFGPGTDGERNPGVFDDQLVRVSSVDGTEFIAYQAIRAVGSSDASIGLPTDVLGQDYYLVSYADPVDEYWQQFVAYAIEDNTQLTVTATGNLDIGVAQLNAGQSHTITLNKGQALFGVTELSKDNELIAGSRVFSNKPIGVVSGNGKLMIGGKDDKDNPFTVLPAVETWGHEYVVTDLAFRSSGSVYQVHTSQDNAELFLDGVQIATLSKGQIFQISEDDVFPNNPSIEVHGLKGAHVINALDNKGEPVGIMLAQYMVSDSATTAEEVPDLAGGTKVIADNTGGPAVALITPTAQYLSRYTFATPPGDQFEYHTIMLTVPNAIRSGVKIDGEIVDSEKFELIPNTDYSFAKLFVAPGSHVVNAEQAFGINMAGYNEADSYLYAGGARFEFINQEGDDYAPTCELGKTQGYSLSVTASDVSGFNEDLNFNGIEDASEKATNADDIFDIDSGIKSLKLDPTSTNLMLDQSDFKPGLDVEFSVSLQDDTIVGSGKVIMVDGRGNEGICIIPEIDGDPIEAKVDEKAPTCNVSNSGGVLEGSASDDIFTEDLDGNGLLNDGESDSNDNDAIDYNSGLASIELVSNSNLKIVMDEELVKGVLTATYKIVLIDVMQDGSGELVVRDVIGNESEVCNLSLDKLKDPTAPDAQAFAYAENPTDLTGLKSITVMQGKVVFLDSSQSSDVDNDIVERAWVIEKHNNFTTSLELTPFTFTQAGTHKVTLTVTDAYGLASTSELEVTVEEPEVIPPEPENTPPKATVGEITVDHNNERVRIDEVEYTIKSTVMYAKGIVVDEDTISKEYLDGKVEYYIWQLLDEDDHVIMEYRISTISENGKYELKEYPYGEEIETPLTRPVDFYKQVEMIVSEEGKFRIGLSGIDYSGAKSEATLGGSSSELANANVYVESGSTGLFAGLFLMLSLLVRRKVKV